MYILIAQCKKGWSGCICLDATEANAVYMLTSLLSGDCMLTMDSALSLAKMIKSAISSDITPTPPLIRAGAKLMGLVTALMQNLSNEFASKEIGGYLSTFGGAVNSFMSPSVQQVIEKESSLSAAISSLLASNEKLTLALTGCVHLGNSTAPVHLGTSSSAMLMSAIRLASLAVGNGSGYAFPNPQDAVNSGSADGFAAQKPVERLTLLPSAMQTAGSVANSSKGNGFVSAQVTLFDTSLNSLLPTAVSTAALSQMNSSNAMLFSRVLSVSLDPAVTSDSSDLVEVTVMFLSPLNESNQTLHCSYLDTCAHFVNSEQ